MAIDFTPDMKEYTGQGKFRYWVQMVLPTIYDDSLSYMELLNKVVYVVNLAIEDVDAVEDNVAALLEAFQNLQQYTNDYFDNLDVQEEINNKLDEMVGDGTLTALLQPLFQNYQNQLNLLEARVDNLTQTITPGGTSGDAELIDVRTAFDGKIYPTAGDSVRGQIEQIKNAINIIDLTAFADHTTRTSAGITYEYLGGNKWGINGTYSSGVSVYNLFYSQTSTFPFVAGEKYKLLFNSPSNNIYLQLYKVINGSLTWVKEFTSNNNYIDFNIPNNAEGILLRIRATGTHDNDICTLYVFNNTPTLELISKSPYTLKSVDTYTQDETGKTDMANAIMDELNNTGYCKLGEGVFYVSGINMPEGSTLEGCGKSTILKLLDNSSNKYAIQIHKFNTISNLSIVGSYTDIDTTPYGNRVGIEFIANHDGSDAGAQYDSGHCMIHDVWISNFSGWGIKGYNTSINYAKGLYCENTYIYNCHIGISLDHYCEFNKFVNVCAVWCWYACVNNSGNNVFTSCTFHATNTGFYINGTSPNSGHGTITGCTFCHIGSNEGTAIKISATSNGFIIDSCQIWYNSIDITNSSGIIFGNCEFGGSEIINISGGNLVAFANCVFMNDADYPPTINVSNNTKTKFDNCYGSVSGQLITP